MDRNKVENPSVVYFYEDYSSEDREWKSVEIAPDFDAFLSKLFRGSILNPNGLKVSYGRKSRSCWRIPIHITVINWIF